MAASISHFPVLMEIKIQPLSLTGQLAVLMLLPLLTWQLSQQLAMERPISSSDPISLPGQDIGPKNASWSNDCFRVYLS